MISVTRVYTQDSNDILTTSINDPSKSWLGLTNLVCSPQAGIIPTVAIYLNDFQLSLTIGVLGLGAGYQDLAQNVAGHEMGHALGLAHSQVQQSLMWNTDDSWIYDRIFLPVADDIRGMAGLYGWAKDTSLPYTGQSSPPPPCAAPCAVPYTLSISSAGQEFYKQTFAGAPLPSSGLAIMFAYVTPLTLYRFHMGWERNTSSPTDTYNRYATLELDNDGAKFVGATNGGAIINIATFSGGNTITPNTSYFLELMVECCTELKATAYVYQGSLNSANGAETFIGYFDSSSGFIDGWAASNYLDTAVWTDSASNPPSSYRIDHFWNFQYGGKTPTGQGSDGSVASGTLITMADGRRLPVQNIQVGSSILVFDVRTRYQTDALVRQIKTTVADTLLTIHTTATLPLRVDFNPNLKLHVMRYGAAVLTPVTELKSGDLIFDYDIHTWVAVTNLSLASGGGHVMYDLVTEPEGLITILHVSPEPLLLEYIANGYPDCPCTK